MHEVFVWEGAGWYAPLQVSGYVQSVLILAAGDGAGWRASQLARYYGRGTARYYAVPPQETNLLRVRNRLYN